MTVEFAVSASGPDSILVSGMASGSPSTSANGERLSVTPQIIPASVVSVMSCHSTPSWCSRCTGVV